MGALKRLTRARAVQEGVGLAVARYLGLVRRTTRFQLEPPDAYDRVTALEPFIIAMWHGQHFMVPFVRRPQDAAASLVSRSGDGELNAIVLRHLGIRAIRGSGARGRSVREKGGAAALRGMLAALEGGETVALTADVPKIARRCGEGIIALARLSGRPILPMAVVTSRRVQFDSWDKASLGLPFGRGAMIIGDPIEVARDANDREVEKARHDVEDELNRVHARAYGLLGARDPGAGLAAQGRTVPIREAEAPGTGT